MRHPSGVDGLMSGIQGMGLRGGEVENLETRERNKEMEEESKAPGAKSAPGAPGSKKPATNSHF